MQFPKLLYWSEFALVITIFLKEIFHICKHSLICAKYNINSLKRSVILIKFFSDRPQNNVLARIAQNSWKEKREWKEKDTVVHLWKIELWNYEKEIIAKFKFNASLILIAPFKYRKCLNWSKLSKSPILMFKTSFLCF